MEACLGVDVGGTKLAAGLVDRSGELLVEARLPTPRSGDEEEVFDSLAEVVSRVLAYARGEERETSEGKEDRETSEGKENSGVGGLPGLVRHATPNRSTPPIEVLACGVGCGGPMEDGGRTVSPLNIPAWRRFPLAERLSAMTGLQVAVDNDAKALALGEGWCGGAKSVPDYMAMVVSTGVGGGVVLGGRLVDGRSKNAGHIGHVVVEPGGRRCSCGGQGCLEAEASGRAIEDISGHPAEDAPSWLVRRTGTLVGRAVASAANLLDLDLVLVAGSVALGFGEPFFEAAQEELALRARLDFSRGTSILPAGLGAKGPLVGAGALGWMSCGEAIP